MNVPQIVGADLSKKTIDFATPQGKHIQTENSKAGFKRWLKWLSELSIPVEQCWVVMEHTGVYSFQLELFLHQQGIRFSKVSGFNVKRSAGMVRGKNDKIDARRIACYGQEKQSGLTLVTPVSVELQQLQQLFSTRHYLVKQRAALMVRVKELKECMQLKATDIMVRVQQQLIDNFTRHIEKISNEMMLIINRQQDLKKNYDLLNTISGVGPIVAIALLIKTHNFTRFNNARKFACYSGTAPFEHSSGSSIRGKTRVSHFADKHMKTLLDLAAKTAIRSDEEIKQYYQRRTNEGKPKMSSINVIRNKILMRAFAIIKRQTPFQTNYLTAA